MIMAFLVLDLGPFGEDGHTVGSSAMQEEKETKNTRIGRGASMYNEIQFHF